MASLKAKAWKQRETNKRATAKSGKTRGLKGPEVMAMTLETGRSSPGQGEVRRKPGGGPKGF